MFTFTNDGAFSRHVFPDIRRTQTRLLRTSNYMATPRHVTRGWEGAPLARSIPMVAGHFKQVPPLTHTNLPTSAFPDTRCKNSSMATGSLLLCEHCSCHSSCAARFSSSTGLVRHQHGWFLSRSPAASFHLLPFLPPQAQLSRRPCWTLGAGGRGARLCTVPAGPPAASLADARHEKQ